MSTILEGYSQNAMVVAAGTDVTVKSINGTAVSGTSVDVKAGQAVVVEGKVKLSRAQLESEPYNLIYNDNDGKYYTKDANGNVVAIDGADDNARNTAWKNALSALEGLNTVASVNVTMGEDGEIEISFEASFNATQDSSYNVQNQNFNTTIKNAEANYPQILEQVYNMKDGDGKTYGIEFIGPDGSAQITMTETVRGNNLVFDHDTGKFLYVGSQGNDTAFMTFNSSASTLTGETIDLTQFSDIEIDFSSVTNWGNGGKNTLQMMNGSKTNSALGAGRKVGDLIGIEVGQDGKITASYDNGLTKLLGQIAVAEFANASGLAKAGNNLYTATQNSGEFDGVGVDITANGGSMTSGVLEMSNVDLSSEFTTMITTQRGFQANSRIITVSDTLLEELVNLKR
ncbi:MAG: flagellar hook-basal body complex protein [Lachnospiraceae bacterium]|nr:flagellar hook-basal body complex protein [Lachnospiraceae bacterium]